MILINCIDHPRIVRYYSAWVEDSYLYIQTELCVGGSVATFYGIRAKARKHTNQESYDTILSRLEPHAKPTPKMALNLSPFSQHQSTMKKQDTIEEESTPSNSNTDLSRSPGFFGSTFPQDISFGASASPECTKTMNSHNTNHDELPSPVLAVADASSEWIEKSTSLDFSVCSDFQDDWLIKQPTEAELLTMVCDVADALFALHTRNIVHLDVKPGL